MNLKNLLNMSKVKCGDAAAWEASAARTKTTAVETITTPPTTKISNKNTHPRNRTADTKGPRF